MKNNQDIKELKKELKNLKNRLKKIEDFLLDLPDFGCYRDPLPYDEDQLFIEAVKIVQQYDRASASLIQRKLGIGYSRAAKILDQLGNKGYIGPAHGSEPRKVLKK